MSWREPSPQAACCQQWKFPPTKLARVPVRHSELLVSRNFPDELHIRESGWPFKMKCAVFCQKRVQPKQQ